MIADDIVRMIYRDGDAGYAMSLAGDTCIEVPFLFRTGERLDELCPVVDGNISTPWARPVYDRMILVDSEQERIVAVESVGVADLPGMEAAAGTDPLPDGDRPVWSVMAAMFTRFNVADGSIVRPLHVARMVGFSSGRITRVMTALGMDEANTEKLALMRRLAGLVMPGDYLPVFDRDLARSIHGDGKLPPLEGVRIEMFLSGQLMSIVAATLSLLCCKNVSTVDAPPPRQARRRAAREGGPTPYTVKTLVVRPMRQRAGAASSSTDKAVPLALHWVRGHFKTYSEEKPLFGRIAGTYWWSAHLAGDVSAGAVVKDYKVEPPDGAGE